MSAVPRVSVVIPTYNRAVQLVEAIGSVLAQSFRDLEIVVCDDGSSDDTAVRAQSFGSAVRYLRLVHTGRPVAARNRGIQAARGEFLAFLDDDDLWEPDKLAPQVELMDTRPELGFVYTDRRLLYADGSLSPVVVTPPPRPAGDMLDLFLTGHFPHICTVLIRLDLVRRVGAFDETLNYSGEEVDLWFRLARIARAGKVAAPLALIRRQVASHSEGRGALPFRHAIDVFERQLHTGDLRLSQRRRCHATLSHLHAQLAATLAAAGDRHGARRAALGALRHRPASARAWAAVARATLRRT